MTKKIKEIIQKITKVQLINKFTLIKKNQTQISRLIFKKTIPIPKKTNTKTKKNDQERPNSNLVFQSYC